jgi:hypothetical protein
MHRENQHKSFARLAAAGQAILACTVVAATSLEDVRATSLLISQFEGRWIFDNQFCAGFSKDEVTLGFEYLPKNKVDHEYVTLGNKKCALKLLRDFTFAVKNPDQCLKNGVPIQFIGEYSLDLGGGLMIDGHLGFKGLDGEKTVLQNCERHK